MSEEPPHVPLRTQKRRHLAFSEETESKWNEPFCFIQAADTQLGLIDRYIKKVDESDITWTEEIEHTRTAIRAANRMSPRPRFFVVCGDLVDAFPEIPGSKYRKAQEKDWNEVFQGLDNEIPLVCVCGNHDLGETPTPETVQSYVEAFGSEDFFSFWCGGVFNIVLNSQFFEDPSRVQDLAETHMKWIDEQLAHAEAKAATHVFVFQHIPFFLETVDEAKDYFNLDNPLRLAILDKFASRGVKGIFCGHYHRNAGGKYKQMEEVITTAVGAVLRENEPSGIRVVNVYRDGFEHKYYPLEEIPLHPGLRMN